MPCGLRQAFRSRLGRPPQQQLIHERMQTAARLLSEDLPVQAVGERVGYADPATFARLFKRHLGMSPRTYRQFLAHGRR